jgi:hypothetical protein
MEARLRAFLEDLESVAVEDEEEAGAGEGGTEWVRLHDAKEALRRFAMDEPLNETPSRSVMTWCWPHERSRLPVTDVRLRMPMDLPCFGELRRPDSGYVLTLEPFAWGRKVHVKMEVDGRLQVFVHDALAIRKVYEGMRGDDGDLYGGSKAR